jgi:hypothetical protein
MAMMVPIGMATSSATPTGNQGAGDQHHDAEVGIVEQRRPLRVGQKIDNADAAEKIDRLGNQHIDDAERGQHRERAAANKTISIRRSLSCAWHSWPDGR